MLSTITFYDSTTKELYGKNKEGINMKFYGDNFEQHCFLSDEDWKTIVVSSSSFSKPLNINGLLHSTMETTIDGNLNGGNGYQLAGIMPDISSFKATIFRLRLQCITSRLNTPPVYTDKFIFLIFRTAFQE